MSSKKVFISEDLWEFVDKNLNIVVPEEFKQGNYEHENLDENLMDLQIEGIKKGWKFEYQDYRIMMVKLAVMDRTSDILDVRHIYDLQCSLPQFLEDLYKENKDIKEYVDSDNEEKTIELLDEIYTAEFGKVTDMILKRDYKSLKNISK
ncbi:unnamed protein product [marine sediment metagenome]|uniref:Uncharacterized protein n=1 Tax=marine sediment metagenome TaxID=412755 RepID=X0RT63_9ZZZZ